MFSVLRQLLFASIVSAIAASSLVAQAPLSLPPDADRAAEAINRPVIEAPIRFLADDLLEGRGPATTGDRIARLYLENQLREMGYEPGAPDGSYQQRIDLVGVTAELPPVWSFATRGGNIDLKHWDDFIGGSGVQRTESKIDGAELVFAGYGIEAPEYKWNDFKGANLKGKVLVMLNNDPDWDPSLFEGNRRLYYGRWTYKYESAARQGAAGAIIIHTTPSAGYPWQVVQTSWSGRQFELPAEGEPRVEMRAWVTEAAARQLMSSAGFDLDSLVRATHDRKFKPVPLGIRTSIRFPNKVETLQSANVIGLLRGSDPVLRNQVVIFTAHHDHLGVGAPKNGDAIYNGALDNASGVGQILAVAHAFKALEKPPKRSVMFLFVAGEEQGLLGSTWFAQHPTFPAGKIVANINADGGNIWGRTRDVTLIGSGKSSLDEIAKTLVARQHRVLKEDQFPDRGFYYRSDQFALAKIGVPALYFDSGTDFVDHDAAWGKEQIETWERRNYHQPSDQVEDSWNYDGMIEDAKLSFLAGLSIAGSDTMPAWKAGDEFEAARRKALADASSAAP